MKKKRRQRYRRKYKVDEAVKRSKKLLPYQAHELLLALDIYVTLLEKQILDLLDSLNVEDKLKEYYLGFAKEVLSLKLQFSGEVLSAELESLISEYVLRGLDESVLRQVEEKVEEKAEEAKAMKMLSVDVLRLPREEENYLLKIGVFKM